MQKFPHLIATILCFIACVHQTVAAVSNTKPAMTLCIDHYPPLQIIQEGNTATGENVEVARFFAAKLGYELTYTNNVPFGQCLLQLKKGEVDLMIGLLGSAQRHRDYHMFLYDAYTVKAVFINHRRPDLKSFSDLKGKNIAIVQNAQQFAQFDNAGPDVLKKTTTKDLKSAFELLAGNKVDAVICTDYYGRNMLKRHPHIRQKVAQASYEVVNGTKVYIALSKLSKYAAKAKAFQQRAVELYLSGEFNQVMDNWRKANPEYYQ